MRCARSSPTRSSRAPRIDGRASTRAVIARALWSLVLRLALPLVFVRLWWRGRREPGYRLAWRERLGFGAASEPGAVWLHAVSLGETRASGALIEALRELRPQVRILL